MIYARKGNRICRVNEHDAQRYLSLGYAIVDENGSVLEQTVPTDVATLHGAYIDHVRQLKAKDEECEALKAHIESLQAQIAELIAEKSVDSDTQKPVTRKSRKTVETVSE